MTLDQTKFRRTLDYFCRHYTTPHVRVPSEGFEFPRSRSVAPTCCCMLSMVRPGYAFSLTTAGVVRRADEAHVDAVPLAPFKQGGGYGQQGVGRWRTTFKLPRQGQTVEPIAARCCGQTERAGIWLGCRDLFLSTPPARRSYCAPGGFSGIESSLAHPLVKEALQASSTGKRIAVLCSGHKLKQLAQNKHFWGKVEEKDKVWVVTWCALWLLTCPVTPWVLWKAPRHLPGPLMPPPASLMA